MNILIIKLCESLTDIDGRFSRISTALRQKNAKTLPELLQLVPESTKNMRAQVTPTVFDIREWVKPHINEIHNHTYPHVYW